MNLGRTLVGSVAVAAGVLAARRWIDTVEVRGTSMAPALQPGDRLVVVRQRRPVRVGDVVLALDPRDAGRELVKRVASIGPDGVMLHGDDPDGSTDGRAFGLVPETAVTWRVVARYWPLDRAGPIGPVGTSDEAGSVPDVPPT